MPSQIKGTALQVYRSWLEARLLPVQTEAILARLSAPTRTVVGGQLLASTRYSYALYAELLEATHAVLGAAYERHAFDHGRYAAEALLAGVYRLTLKTGDVERTLELLADGWQIFFDTGRIRIAEKAKGRYVFAIVDPHYHVLHPPISAGYVQRACELAGATRVDVGVQIVAPRVDLTITWS